MPVMSYEGVVSKGVVRLAKGIKLPESAKVYVVLPDTSSILERPKFDLATMLSNMPDDYAVSEEGFGAPRGKEVW